MAWTNLTFSFGAILTSTQMTQLDNNFEALANGDAGAPPIQEAALAAAVQAQLVSNGDSHDHSGGDGATIGANGVVTTSITNGAVTSAKITKTSTQNQVSIISGSPWTIPAGMHLLCLTNVLTVQVYINSAWRTLSAASAGSYGNFVLSDGTNMRVASTGVASWLYYRSFS